jgi:hypothetical protein
MSFTQSLFQKKIVNVGSILFGRKWLKFDEILVQNISFQSFILFNQSITYLVLGVNKLKGNKSKQQIFDMNSKNDTCIMY